MLPGKFRFGSRHGPDALADIPNSGGGMSVTPVGLWEGQRGVDTKGIWRTKWTTFWLT